MGSIPTAPTSLNAQVAQWQEAIVLGTIQCQFESDLEYQHTPSSGLSPHYIFNMSAHRARIPTKLPLAEMRYTPLVT